MVKIFQVNDKKFRGANFYFYFTRQALTCRTFQFWMLVPLFGIRIIGKVPCKAPSPNPWDTSGWDPKRAPSGLWGSQGVGRRKTQASRRWTPVRSPSGFSSGCPSLCLLPMQSLEFAQWLPIWVQGQKEKGTRKLGTKYSGTLLKKIPCLIMTLLTRDNVLFFPECGLGIPLAGLQMLIAYMWYFRNGLNLSL